MNWQATRNAEPIRIRDQRIRNLPLWVETTRRARAGDWAAGLIFAGFMIFVVMA